MRWTLENSTLKLLGEGNLLSVVSQIEVRDAGPKYEEPASLQVVLPDNTAWHRVHLSLEPALVVIRIRINDQADKVYLRSEPSPLTALSSAGVFMGVRSAPSLSQALTYDIDDVLIRTSP